MSRGQIVYQNEVSADKQELQPELISIMKEEVGRARERRMPIIRAFEAIAERSGLKANTIRNYYYRYIHDHGELTRDAVINTKSDFTHDEAIGRPFTPQETKELMREMLISQIRGESVRGCANRLSGGDKRVLIRLQNKYRSIIAREPEYVEELIRELKNEGISCYNPYSRNRAVKVHSGSFSNTKGSEGQLIDWIGQFVSNMQSIKNASMDSLIKGLRDLSGLAAGNSRSQEFIDKHDREIQELNNKIIILESSLERERKEMRRMSSRLSSLVDVNRHFIEQSDTEKLSGLKDYVEQLETQVGDSLRL